MTVEVYFSGRVQGVNFRYNLSRKARELGLAGYVQNLEDGRVKAVIEGSEQRIQELLYWAKKGPGLALVEETEVRQLAQKEPLSGFEIRY